MYSTMLCELVDINRLALIEGAVNILTPLRPDTELPITATLKYQSLAVNKKITKYSLNEKRIIRRRKA